MSPLGLDLTEMAMVVSWEQMAPRLRVPPPLKLHQTNPAMYQTLPPWTLVSLLLDLMEVVFFAPAAKDY
jgi:hypothetical protein